VWNCRNIDGGNDKLLYQGHDILMWMRDNFLICYRLAGE
jgi:hypothetical protein